MSTLILHLPLAPPGPSTEYRYTLSSDGQHVSSQGCAAVALLPRPSRATGETVALVPAQMLSWQRVQLPQGNLAANSPRLRAVLDGLLEERLLDEPAQLHLALQPPTSANNALWVAVCARAWLQGHLQALEQAGMAVARIVPEAAPPLVEDALPSAHILGTPDDAHLLLQGYGTKQGVLLLPFAAPALALMRHAAPEASAPPALYAEPAVAALAEQLLGQPVPLQSAHERALQALGNGWNLAQFDLAQTGQRRALRKLGAGLGALVGAAAWRPARWALGTLVLAHLVGLNASAWQERRTLEAKQAQVRAILTQTFPQVPLVVDAPLQMERQLALLRQATGSLSAQDLEPLLASSARALPSSWALQGLDYSSGQLRLRGPALSADAQTQVEQQLRASGQRFNTEGDTLIVRPADTP
jgi:general secretion pathway protein L